MQQNKNGRKSPEATKTTETTETTTKGDDEKVAYACPMDCEKGKTYDQPGKCPKCEMDLEKK
jgi:transcription initiation factor IIE alpha subunit